AVDGEDDRLAYQRARELDALVAPFAELRAQLELELCRAAAGDRLPATRTCRRPARGGRRAVQPQIFFARCSSVFHASGRPLVASSNGTPARPAAPPRIRGTALRMYSAATTASWCEPTTS